MFLCDRLILFPSSILNDSAPEKQVKGRLEKENEKKQKKNDFSIRHHICVWLCAAY